jgi:hypothetical protein
MITSRRSNPDLPRHAFGVDDNVSLSHSKSCFKCCSHRWVASTERYWVTLAKRRSENTLMFVQIAEGLGIRSILHTDYASTRAKLASFGLSNDVGLDSKKEN